MNKFNKRREGALQPLKGEITPKRFIFFDTETKVPLKENNIRSFDLILGVAIFIELNNDLTIKQKVIYKFRTALEFLDIIQYHNRSKQLLYIFAHNIGFDVRVLGLPELFDSVGFTSEPPIINQMAFIWRVKSDRGNYLFLDTANLGVRSVASLGLDMGYPKAEIDFTKCSIDELFDYCTIDVDIIASFVTEYIRYIDENHLGSFKVTLASQALCAFRSRFMYNPPIIHNYQDVIKLEREAYHGGRVECFALGKQPRKNWFYLDVNSMYPFAMKGDDLPVALLGYSTDVRLKEFAIRLKNYYLIADVIIDTDEPCYPLLRNNKLIFPIGKFRVTLNHHELEYAYNHGHIKKIFQSAQYKRGSIFDTYIDFFYAEKVKHTIAGNKTLKTISKLYLNSLYGKFGQTEPHRENFCHTEFKGVYREPSFDVETKMHFQWLVWYGTIYKEYRQGETSFSCPYLASAITSKARMLLWMYIKHAGRENVKYCDTDSLITSARGYKRLLSHISETRLGALKLETQSQCFELYGNKDYVFGADKKHKGIPTKATKINEEQWEYLEFQGFIDWLNKGAKGSPKGEFKTKQRRTTYNKGIINHDNTVNPFRFDEWKGHSIVPLANYQFDRKG